MAVAPKKTNAIGTIRKVRPDKSSLEMAVDGGGVEWFNFTKFGNNNEIEDAKQKIMPELRVKLTITTTVKGEKTYRYITGVEFLGAKKPAESTATTPFPGMTTAAPDFGAPGALLEEFAPPPEMPADVFAGISGGSEEVQIIGDIQIPETFDIGSETLPEDDAPQDLVIPGAFAAPGTEEAMDMPARHDPPPERTRFRSVEEPAPVPAKPRTLEEAMNAYIEELSDPRVQVALVDRSLDRAVDLLTVAGDGDIVSSNLLAMMLEQKLKDGKAKDRSKDALTTIEDVVRNLSKALFKLTTTGTIDIIREVQEELEKQRKPKKVIR